MMIVTADWIRPWYPAGSTGHTRANCPALLAADSNPAPGSGWLALGRGNVCADCLTADPHLLWDAECATCRWSMKQEAADDGRAHFASRDDAIAWRKAHRCLPDVSLIPPKLPAAAERPDQPALFAPESTS